MAMARTLSVGDAGSRRGRRRRRAHSAGGFRASPSGPRGGSRVLGPYRGAVPAVTTTPLTTPTGPVEIPTLGLGVSQVPDDEAYPAVLTALEAGYRHVDTAKLYGNERGVGRAVAESGIPRDEVFVTTKVWNDDQGRDRTLRAVDASMERLGLDVLDLLLIHWPVPRQDKYVETWRVLQDLRDAGRVRAIGVSNFHAEHLARLAEETGEWPAINQVECHPYLQQTALRAFDALHGIATESWSPLASGRKVLDDPVVGRVAREHGATPAQVVIAWHLANDLVVIPKSVTPSRIVENLEAADLVLTAEDLEAIEALDRGFRTGPNPETFDHA